MLKLVKYCCKLGAHALEWVFSIHILSYVSIFIDFAFNNQVVEYKTRHGPLTHLYLRELFFPKSWDHKPGNRYMKIKHDAGKGQPLKSYFEDHEIAVTVL